MTERMNKINENDENNQIVKWVVNDYFTPNIKAEVILDTLLTPYIAEILKDQRKDYFTGELDFITKEMSVLESEDSKKDPNLNNRGTKIDYVLGDEKFIYLVELKTTDSSIKTEQAKRYLKNCLENGKPKTFGEVFGNKLLSIMKGAFGNNIYESEFPWPQKSDNVGAPQREEEALKKAFESVFRIRFRKKDSTGKPFKIGIIGEPPRYAESAKELIRLMGWTQSNKARSRKYLYTAGQLLDYYVTHGRSLWDKPLKFIYLTPRGKSPSEEFEEYKDFYMGSFSLQKASKYLKGKEGDELAQLLACIIDEIYFTKKEQPNND